MRVVSIHLKYIFSNKSLILLYLSIAIIGVVFLKTAGDVNNLPVGIANSHYFYESSYIYKMIYYFIVIYMWITNFTFEKLEYYCLLINYKINRFSFIILKILILIIITLCYSIISIFIYNIVGSVMIRNFTVNSNISCMFIKYMLITTIYAMLGSAINIVLRSDYLLVLTYIVALLSIISENDDDLGILINSNSNIYLVILALLILIILIVIIFQKIDLTR